MQNLLQDLRHITTPEQMTPEQRAAVAALNPYLTAIQKTFGLSFTNALEERYARISELELDEAFARGFWLGGNLAAALKDGR